MHFNLLTQNLKAIHVIFCERMPYLYLFENAKKRKTYEAWFRKFKKGDFDVQVKKNVKKVGPERRGVLRAVET